MNKELNKLAKSEGITLTNKDVTRIENYMYRVYNLLLNLEGIIKEEDEGNSYGGEKELIENIKSLFYNEESYMNGKSLSSKELRKLFEDYSIDIE